MFFRYSWRCSWFGPVWSQLILFISCIFHFTQIFLVRITWWYVWLLLFFYELLPYMVCCSKGGNSVLQAPWPSPHAFSWCSNSVMMSILICNWFSDITLLLKTLNAAELRRNFLWFCSCCSTDLMELNMQSYSHQNLFISSSPQNVAHLVM